MSDGTISTFSVTKGGKIDDTYASFQAWDLSRSLNANLEALAEENPILAGTDAWMREMRRIFRVRFGEIEVHEPLIRLAQAGMPRQEWSPILLWHLCYRELLLSDFLETWLYDRKQEGILRITSDDVREYLATLRSRGLLNTEWSKNTVNRMASGLPAYATDFGLLEGRNVREIVPFHLPEKAFLYVLYSIHDSVPTASRLLADIRWRRFLMSESDVEHELLRLHQLQKVHYEVAGSVISLELPHPSLEGYVDALV